MHGRDADFQAPGQRIRLRPARHPDPGGGSPSSAIPPARALGAGSSGQPGVGRRPGLRRGFHVRRSALPSPGTEGQLRELAARIMEPAVGPHPAALGGLPRGGTRGRPVRHPHQDPPRDDRRHGGGGHQSGDPWTHPDPKPAPDLHWEPVPGPSGAELVAGAVVDTIRRPAAIVDHARKSLTDVSDAAANALRQAGGLVTALWSAAAPAEPAQRPHRRPAPLREPPRWTSRTSRPSVAITGARSATSCWRWWRVPCAPG